MYSLEKIRKEMAKRLELDNQLNCVEVNADSVDEALADASVQLDTKLNGLEYEVVERGRTDFLESGKSRGNFVFIRTRRLSRQKDARLLMICSMKIHSRKSRLKKIETDFLCASFWLVYQA